MAMEASSGRHSASAEQAVRSFRGCGTAHAAINQVVSKHLAKKPQMQWTLRGESCMTGLPPKFNALRFGTDSAMTLYRVLCLVMRPASISVIVALCCLCMFDVAADIATGAA